MYNMGKQLNSIHNNNMVDGITNDEPDDHKKKGVDTF